MFYQNIYTEILPEQYPELAQVSKEHLVRLCFDGSLAGATNVRMAEAAYRSCRSIRLDNKDEAMCRHCDRVSALVDAAAAAKKAFKDALLASQPDQAEIAEKKKAYEDAAKTIIAVTEAEGCPCQTCKYHSHITKKSGGARLNYARYTLKDHKGESLANTKVYLALCWLVVSSYSANFDKPGEVDPGEQIHIRHLANICHLSASAVRKSLKYWTEQNMIYADAAEDPGVWQIGWRRGAATAAYKKTSEGGAGFLMLPAAAMRALLALDRIDTLRMSLLAFLNADTSIYHDNYQIRGGLISADGELMRYVVRHQRASMTDLIDRTNKAWLIGDDIALRLYLPQGAKALPSAKLYETIKIDVHVKYAPRQQSVIKNIDGKSGREIPPCIAKEMEDYVITQTGRSTNEDSKSRKAPWDNLLLAFLFPRADEQTWICTESLHRPRREEDTLIPACRTIANKVGYAYFEKSVSETLTQCHAAAQKMCIDISSALSPEKYAEDIAMMSRAMIGIAKAKKTSYLSKNPRQINAMLPTAA